MGGGGGGGGHMGRVGIQGRGGVEGVEKNIDTHKCIKKEKMTCQQLFSFVSLAPMHPSIHLAVAGGTGTCMPTYLAQYSLPEWS